MITDHDLSWKVLCIPVPFPTFFSSLFLVFVFICPSPAPVPLLCVIVPPTLVDDKHIIGAKRCTIRGAHRSVGKSGQLFHEVTATRLAVGGLLPKRSGYWGVFLPPTTTADIVLCSTEHMHNQNLEAPYHQGNKLKSLATVYGIPTRQTGDGMATSAAAASPSTHTRKR